MAVGDQPAAFGGGSSPSGADPFATNSEATAAVAGPRRFFKVDDTNLYVFMGDQTQAPSLDMNPRDLSNSSDDLLSVTSDSNLAAMHSSTSSASVMVNASEEIRYEDLEIMKHLGTGQQGSVFSARHKGTTYAVKKISVQDAFNTTHAVERQARKAAIVRELTMVAQRANRSEYLVALYNAYFKKQELIILMEHMSFSLEDLVKDVSRIPYSKVKQIMQKTFGNSISGITLEKPITMLSFEPPSTLNCEYHTQFPEMLVSLIAHDALNGLMHLHEKMRVVHLDVKSANVMLSQNLQTFKLADFGCSMELDATGRVAFNGVNLGTKLYMSPERARGIYSNQGTHFDVKTDIWSLGIMLAELAGGCHPCEAIREDFWNFGERLKLEELVMPITCTSLLYDFLVKCLQTDPAKRASARELLRHDFIRKYSRISRPKLAQFVGALRQEAPQYWRKLQQEEVRRHWQVAAQTRDNDMARKAGKTWQGFVRGRGIGIVNVPSLNDKDSFPSL